MPRKTGEKKDRTSLVISLVLHLILIGAVGYWAWKSGVAEKIARRVLQFVRDEQKKETKPEQAQVKQTPPPKLPPINQGLPPPPSSGTRRAVAADAPEAAGETFFQDLRKQVQGAGSGSTGPTQKVEVPKIIIPPPPPRPTLLAPPPSTIKEALKARAEATAAIEAFSSEQISKSGAGDVGEVIGKVAGATVVDGKFAVIRGLPDRYASASLNGGEIPSADPYRKSVQLDLFPSAMIDRVVVAKTFTPDQPGGFTGGAIDIVSKSFPDRFHFSISGGVGYNEQATFNERFLTYDGGSRDWLGMDDGTRKEPSALARIENIAELPVLYPPTEQGRAEVQRYVALQRSFGTRQMGPTQEEAPFNRSFGLSVGDVGYLFGRRLGAFGALSYDRKFSFYDEGSQARYSWPILTEGERGDPGTPTPRQSLADTRAVDEVSWAGTASIAYELAPDHQVGFTYLFSQNGEDQARLRVGQSSQQNVEQGVTAYLNELHWTERNLNTYQFHGKHLFEVVGGLGMNWLYSMANTSQDEPDYRLFNFTQTPEGTIQVSGSSGVPEPSGGPTRFFRNLEEDTSTFKLDFSLPFRAWRYLGGDVKFGGYLSTSDRIFNERTYTFKPETDSFVGDPREFPNELLSDNQLSFRTNTNPRGGVTSYVPTTTFTDELGNSAMTGSQEIQAFYAMATLPIYERLRLVGGARYEATDLQVESSSRLLGEGHGIIEEVDVLPAFGIIYSPRKDMNIRFNFAQTIARPTYREFSLIRSYDVTGGEIFIGNPNLVMSHIDNLDLRWEWFPRPGELLSASLFYKDIESPIERYAVDARKGDEITYTNFPSAKVYGVEFEARKTLGFLDSLLEEFSVGLNYSLIESESENVESILITKREAGFTDETRPLFDQSPYIITADLTYDNPRWGTTISLGYSIFGERLYLVNNAGADVYEQPAPQLDLIFSQRIGRHWRFKFSAKNLLDPWFQRKYGSEGELDNEGDLEPYSSYRRGRTFTVSLNFDY